MAFTETDITFTADIQTANWFHRLFAEKKFKKEDLDRCMTAGLKAFLAARERRNITFIDEDQE